MYFALSYLPATYITNYLHKLSNGKLHFMQTSGTVMNGMTHIGLAYAAQDDKPIILPTPLTWNISVDGFSSMALNIQHLNLAKPLSINVFKKNISIIDLRGLPLNFLSGLKGPLFSLGLEGRLSLFIPAFYLNSSNINLAGARIYLDDVYRKDLPNFILGSYEINMSNNGENFTVHTNMNKSNILNIQGFGHINPFQFNGEAIPNQLFKNYLSPFLSSIGYSKNGKTYIQF